MIRILSANHFHTLRKMTRTKAQRTSFDSKKSKKKRKPRQRRKEDEESKQLAVSTRQTPCDAKANSFEPRLNLTVQSRRNSAKKEAVASALIFSFFYSSNLIFSLLFFSHLLFSRSSYCLSDIELRKFAVE